MCCLVRMEQKEEIEFGLEKIKERLLDNMIMLTAVVGLPSIIIVMINSRISHHFPIFSIAGYGIILCFLFFRRYIPFSVKVWTLLFFAYLLGTRGLLNEGILSHGMLFYMFMVILASMLVSSFTGMWIMVVNLATVCVVYYLMKNGYVIYHFDIADYATRPSTWLGFVAIILLFAGIGIMIFNRIQQNMLGFIDELIIKSESLNHSNNILEAEIRERRKTETQLLNSEIKFRNVFNSIKNGIILCDHNQDILDVNDALSEMTGIRRDAIIGKHFGTLFANWTSSGGDETFFSFHKNELQLRVFDEPPGIPVELTYFTSQQSQEYLTIIVIEDIRDRKQNEQKILNAIIDSEENERLRISQNLHDTVGPLLSAAKLYISSIDSNDIVKNGIDLKKEIQSILSQATSSVRDISSQLSSHLVQSQGLKNALEDIVAKLTFKSDITVKIDIPDGISFQDKPIISLYRILVELIHNTVKHAHASEVSIAMIARESDIIIQYRDNGQGFDLNAIYRDKKGMGLYNIHSRIKTMNGSVKIETSPHNGFCLEAIFRRGALCL